MFEDLVAELDRDQSPALAQFGRAVLADLPADDLDGTSDANTIAWIRMLFAALESGRTVAVSNDTGRPTSAVVVTRAMAHLAESISLVLSDQTVQRLFQTLLMVTRDGEGGVTGVERPDPGADGPLTALVYVEVDRIDDED